MKWSGIDGRLSGPFTLILGALSAAGATVLGLTCLATMSIGLMFCDNCSGIGDWVIFALPLCVIAAAAVGSTFGGFILCLNGRRLSASLCLAAVPALFALVLLYPPARNWSRITSVVSFPFEFYAQTHATRDHTPH